MLRVAAVATAARSCVSRPIGATARMLCVASGSGESTSGGADDGAAGQAVPALRAADGVVAVKAPQPFEFMSHFSHRREKTLAEVVEEYKRSAAKVREKVGDSVLPNTRPSEMKDWLTPTNSDGTVINPTPESPYPVAKLYPPRNSRQNSMYGYQRFLYQQQLTLLRRKWKLEHTMEKERKLRIRKAKELKMVAQRSSIKEDDAYLARKKERIERHEMRVEKRLAAKHAKKARNAAHLKQREAEMRRVRMEAIESLDRLSKNFITLDNYGARMNTALDLEENFDVDVVIQPRKGFDPKAEHAEQILRRLQRKL